MRPRPRAIWKNACRAPSIGTWPSPSRPRTPCRRGSWNFWIAYRRVGQRPERRYDDPAYLPRVTPQNLKRHRVCIRPRARCMIRNQREETMKKTGLFAATTLASLAALGIPLTADARDDVVHTHY